MYEVNFEIPAFLLSLFCFLYCVIAKRRQYIPPKKLKNKLSNQHFTFLLMLMTNMLSSLSSVLGVYLLDLDFKGLGVLLYLFHAFYFFFHSTLSIVFTQYIINVTGTNVHWKKWTYILFGLPYLVSELIILTNVFTKWAFYMDENLVYHRGPLMFFLYGVGGFYLVLGFVFFLKNKKAISRVDSVAVAVFIGIATLGIVLQAVRSSLLVELYCEAMACLVLMIVLEEKAGHMEPTTGLLNRVAFADSIRKLMSSRQMFYVVLVKLKELDRIARRFSGRETDMFLMQVSSFLDRESGVSDVFCVRREEFAILFKDVELMGVPEFTDKVLARFSEDWETGAYLIHADAHVCVIRVPEDAQTPLELDGLLSASVQDSLPGSRLVEPEEIRESAKAGVYEAALRRAVSERKLELHYQPIWSTAVRKTLSAEALLRVNTDELRDVSPEVYIPIAEKSGLIREIGEFVFEEVCNFLTDKRLERTDLEYVELNLSVSQFTDKQLIDRFEEIRKKYGVDASKINLEITETAAAIEGNTILDTLDRFKELGYTLSLDDVGTGYSNLIRMIGGNFKNIKIDKSILWKAMKDEDGKDLLKNLTGFVKTLGSDVIQEGVETKEQLDIVVACGADYIQGYYFSKPVPENAFFDYLGTNAEGEKGHTASVKHENPKNKWKLKTK